MLYVYHPDDSAGWAATLASLVPDVPITTWPEPPKDRVRWLAVWNPPPDFFRQFGKVEAIFLMGAGVDKFLARPDFPHDVPILTRLVDAGMAPQMAEYVLYAVLHFHREFHSYLNDQTAKRWHELPPSRPADEVRVTVLGLGAIGSVVAKRLAANGYTVSGWSRSEKEIAGVRWSSDLDGLLPDTDVLVNVLPNTPDTAGLLDRTRLAKLAKGAVVVNVGRANQLVGADLLALLDEGHLGGAFLDVFDVEPLPADNPLWSHPKVVVTPHISARTLRREGAQQIAANLRAVMEGRTPPGLVDRKRNY